MNVLVKFAAGVVMTLLFVIAVPYVSTTYITPYIISVVGDNSLLFIGSETLIQLLIMLVMILFILLLGGGAIFRWFGVFGVLGMILAYYLLGDVTKAIIPVLSLVVVYIITIPFRNKKEDKKKDKAYKKKA